VTDGKIHTAYIGFGGNIGDVLASIAAARQALDGLFRINAVSHSSLYRSKPHGDVEQDDFINAVSSYETSLCPMQLLKEMITIETTLGRTRETHWGPRTIDIDLLLYADVALENETLTLPHPRLHEREFVLYPLNEIAPHVSIPDHGLVSILTVFCPANGIEKLTQLGRSEAIQV